MFCPCCIENQTISVNLNDCLETPLVQLFEKEPDKMYTLNTQFHGNKLQHEF